MITQLYDFVGARFIVQALIFIFLLGLVLGVIKRFLDKEIMPYITESRTFYNDWHGTPERLGISLRVPGVMERLSTLEAQVLKLTEAINGK